MKTPRPRSSPALAVAVVALVLSGCASTSGDEMTLASTKSTVQLLRNEVAKRVDARLLDTVRTTTDESVACLSADDDPEARQRQWKSGADLVLVDGSDAELVAGQVVTSLSDQGWQVRQLGGGDAFDLVILTREASVAQIMVASAEEAGVPLVRIESVGPCVATDGPDSDEVKRLSATN